MTDNQPNPEALMDVQFAEPAPQYDLPNYSTGEGMPAPDPESQSNKEETSSPATEAKALLTGIQQGASHHMLLTVVSIVLLIPSSILCFDGNSSGSEAFAVSVSIVSMCVAGFVAGQQRMECVKNLPEKFMFYIAVFLFIWWTAAVAVLTFFSPFLTTSNGYFATWGGFALSCAILGEEVEQFKVAMHTALGSKSLGLLIAASSVELFASISPCSHYCGNVNLMALIMGAVSLAVSVAMIFLKDKVGLGISYVWGFLGIWWLIAVFTLTMKGPFTTTGNGFFATWIALIASVLLIHNK